MPTQDTPASARICPACPSPPRPRPGHASTRATLLELTICCTSSYDTRLPGQGSYILGTGKWVRSLKTLSGAQGASPSFQKLALPQEANQRSMTISTFRGLCGWDGTLFAELRGFAVAPARETKAAVALCTGRVSSVPAR